MEENVIQDDNVGNLSSEATTARSSLEIEDTTKPTRRSRIFNKLFRRKPETSSDAENKPMDIVQEESILEHDSSHKDLVDTPPPGQLEVDLDSETEEPRKEHELQDKFLLSSEKMDISELKRQIALSKGKLRIWVHPYNENNYRDKYPGEQIADDSTLQRYEKALNKFLKSDSSQKPPILVMEDSRHLNQTARKLNKTASKETDVWYLSTNDNRPEPRFDYEKSRYPWKGSTWGEMQGLLKDAGVKSILVGGMYLGEADEQGEHTHCVGETMRKLQDEFEVKQSNIVIRA